MSIGPLQRPNRATYALILSTVVIVSIIGVMTVPAGAQSDLPMTVDVPSEATVGEPVSITGTVSTPELMGGVDSKLAMSLTVDGRVVSSKTLSVTDGEEATVSFRYDFDSVGTHTVEIEATVDFAGQTFRNGISRDIDVSSVETVVPTRSETALTPTLESAQSTTIEGAAFAVPDSLQTTVDSYRKSLPTSTGTSAFVLATPDDIHLVFSDTQPRTGMATVEGVVLRTEVSVRDVSLTLVAASEVRFDTDGKEVSVEAIASEPEAYQLDLVRVRATHRRIATLTDPDQSNAPTVPSSSGHLVNGPAPVSRMFQEPGSRTRSLLLESTEKLESNTDIRAATFETDNPGLYTVGVDTTFWTDSRSVVDGIVITPGSEVRQFLVAFGAIDGAKVAKNEAFLYVVDSILPNREYDSVSSLKRQASDGETVSVKANILGQHISVQETMEHGTPCGSDLAQVPSPSGPVCVDVIQDTLIHTGAAWTTGPESMDDVLLVVGLSSREQDSPIESFDGEYRLIGEVVSTSRIDPRLPEGRILVIYGMERVGDDDFGRLNRQERSLIENGVGELESSVLAQVNSPDGPTEGAGGADRSSGGSQPEPTPRAGQSDAANTGSEGILSSTAQVVQDLANGLVDLFNGASGLFE